MSAVFLELTCSKNKALSPHLSGERRQVDALSYRILPETKYFDPKILHLLIPNLPGFNVPVKWMHSLQIGKNNLFIILFDFVAKIV